MLTRLLAWPILGPGYLLRRRSVAPSLLVPVLVPLLALVLLLVLAVVMPPPLLLVVVAAAAVAAACLLPVPLAMLLRLLCPQQTRPRLCPHENGG